MRFPVARRGFCLASVVLYFSPCAAFYIGGGYLYCSIIKAALRAFFGVFRAGVVARVALVALCVALCRAFRDGAGGCIKV